MIFWFANLGYIFHTQLVEPAILAEHQINSEYLWFRSITMVNAVISDIPVFLAGRLVRKKTLSIYDSLIPLLGSLIWILIFSFLVNEDQLFWSIIFATVSGVAAMSYLFSGLWNLHKKKLNYRLFKYFAISLLILSIWQVTFLAILTEWGRTNFVYFKFIALGIKFIVFIFLGLVILRNAAKFYSFEEVKLSRNLTTLETQKRSKNLDKLTRLIQHEVKIPITLMTDSIKKLMNRHKDDTTSTKELTEINTQRLRILAATNIMNILQASVASIANELTLVSLKDEVQGCVKELKKALKKETLNINFDYKEKKQNLYIKAHRDLIRFAFTNIIKNAIEATQKTSKNGFIEITFGTYNKEQSQVFVSFKDNGIGLPEGVDPNKLKDLGVSYNKDNNSLERSNHGVGLFVSDHIIALHGGTLELKSNKEGGSEVVVVLPREETNKQKTLQNGESNYE
jgi:signal transduction histidine kinase